MKRATSKRGRVDADAPSDVSRRSGVRVRARPEDRPAAETLTANEAMLVDWLAAGRTNAEIGQCLARSEKTVKNQLTRIYAKLGVANRAEAVAVYLRNQWLASP